MSEPNIWDLYETAKEEIDRLRAINRELREALQAAKEVLVYPTVMTPTHVKAVYQKALDALKHSEE